MWSIKNCRIKIASSVWLYIYIQLGRKPASNLCFASACCSINLSLSWQIPNQIKIHENARKIPGKCALGMIKKKEEKSLKYTTSQHSLQRAHLRFALFLPAMQQKLYHSYYMLCSIPTTKSSERIRSWNYVDLRFFLSVSSSSFLYFFTSQKKVLKNCF